MQEVLSKPGYEKLPRAEQEFYELRIEDSGDMRRPGFLVKQPRALWNERDNEFTWEIPEMERWLTLQEARTCYEARRETLRAKGFTESDMDLF